METPNSGAVDTSLNLGDLSKLDSIPDSGANLSGELGEVTPEVDNDSESNLSGEVSDQVDDSGANEVAPQVDTPPAASNKGRPSRDYSGLAPEDVEIFSKMSLAAFNKLKPIYLAKSEENKKLAELEANYNKVKDLQFYHHPEAYRLSEDYTATAQQVQTATMVSNYWQEQLAKLDAGEPINDLIPDSKGGYTVDPNPIQPSPQVKAQLTRALIKSSSEAQALTEKLNNVQNSFKTKYTEFDQSLNTIDTQILAPHRKSPEFAALEKSMLEFIPPELRNTSQGKALAGLGALTRAQADIITKLQAQLGTKKAVRQTVTSSGPGEGTPANGSKSSNGAPSSWKEAYDDIRAYVGR